MSNSKGKDNIPLDVKKSVWEKYSIYPCNPEITQCRTCENIVMIPQAIRQHYNTTYNILQVIVDGKSKKISGTAEFGHIISEKNGGKATVENLLIQCKACNLKQMTNNILPSRLITDYVMLDVTNNLNVEMGENCDTCQKTLGNGIKCKNKAIFNRRFCHIHLSS
jgi:hypothetical protein